jgi:hypothetical protein
VDLGHGALGHRDQGPGASGSRFGWSVTEYKMQVNGSKGAASRARRLLTPLGRSPRSSPCAPTPGASGS